MTIAFRSATTLNRDFTSSGIAFSVAVPAGVQAGDVVLVLMNHPLRAAQPAAPAGFTTVLSYGSTEGGDADQANVVVYGKTLTGADTGSYSFVVGGSNQLASFAVVALAYSGASLPLNASAGATQVGAVSSIIAPSITTTVDGSFAVFAWAHNTQTNTLEATSGTNSRGAVLGGSAADAFRVADLLVPSAGATGTNSAGSASTLAPRRGVSLALAPSNQPPNAPTLVDPVGTTFDRAVAKRFDWDFSDPNAGDTQSKYDIRTRPDGGVFTTVSVTTPNTFHDFAAGHFPAGPHDWQVLTYDALGLAGPWSAVGFFTAANAPTAPTITSAVIDGGTVSATPSLESWSFPSADAFEWRTVADSAGVPNPSIVYQSGTVAGSVRSVQVPYLVTGRTEHFQVRSQVSGLFSPYTSRRRVVSFSLPSVPTVTLTASNATGSIAVAVGNPGGGAAATASHDLYRRETAVGGLGIRIATGLAPASTFTDRTPASGVGYEYRAVSIADSGASSTSGWVG